MNPLRFSVERLDSIATTAPRSTYRGAPWRAGRRVLCLVACLVPSLGVGAAGAFFANAASASPLSPLGSDLPVALHRQAPEALDDAAKKDGTPSPGKPKSTPQPSAEEWKSRSIWTIECTTLEGEPAALSAYEGKVALVVNVASRCGMTPQYAALEKLAAEYKDRGVVVLAFPCNDFGNQEPGTAQEIREFCTTRYKVTFPIFAKVSVKSGEQQAPLYQALQAKTGATPKWNFGKFLVSRDGTRAQFFDSRVAPDAKELREALERLIAEPALSTTPPAAPPSGTAPPSPR